MQWQFSVRTLLVTVAFLTAICAVAPLIPVWYFANPGMAFLAVAVASLALRGLIAWASR